MADSKVEIKIGEIEFTGQDDADWVAQQLDKILAQAEKLVRLAPPAESKSNRTENNSADNPGHKPMGADSTIAKKTLPAFLQEKNATTKQVRKFLATAVGSRLVARVGFQPAMWPRLSTTRIKRSLAIQLIV